MIGGRQSFSTSQLTAVRSAPNYHNFLHQGGAKGELGRVYLWFCQNLADQVPNSPVVDKRHSRNTQDKVAAELASMGGV